MQVKMEQSSKLMEENKRLQQQLIKLEARIKAFDNIKKEIE